MKIIAGSSNPQLAKTIAKNLKTPLVACEISKFSNGEKRIRVGKEAKREHILLVQSFSEPVDEHIIETLLIADALERLGTRSVELFVPWFGYSFQDKVFQEGEPLSAKVIARIVESTCIKKVYLLDLHNISIPGFFSIPTYHLSGVDIFVDYAKKEFDLTNTMVVSPDFGGLKRARVFADALSLDLASVEKRRNLKTGEVTTTKLDGEVSGKIVLIFDDAILSGGTTIEVSKFLKEKGAKQVHFFATHGVFTGKALADLSKSKVNSVVVSNSIAHNEHPKKITVLDVSPALVENL
ncbi:MAG TPA: ribose-phosphate pyrophosphokinase [Patescibacteria group bacterium]|jgi:ribose-phosphate pyrophosphokinase